MSSNDGKPNNKLAATRNRIQEMRMAMKAKMAADKERLRAEKRHQEVCLLDCWQSVFPRNSKGVMPRVDQRTE